MKRRTTASTEALSINAVPQGNSQALRNGFLILDQGSNSTSQFREALEAELKAIDPNAAEELASLVAQATGDPDCSYLGSQISRIASLAATIGLNRAGKSQAAPLPSRASPTLTTAPTTNLTPAAVAAPRATPSAAPATKTQADMYAEQQKERETKADRAQQIRAQYDALPTAAERAAFWAKHSSEFYSS